MRNGSASGDLMVSYSLSGTAAKISDYRRSQGDMPESIVIPSGANSATLTVIPVALTTLVGDKTAILTLSSNANYDIGVQNAATIIIGGNGISGTKISRAGNGVTLNWPSGSGYGYRVLRNTSATNPAWIDAGADINSGGSTTSWTDSFSPGTSQRYYRVFQSR